jgi:hypothetical protein
MLPLEISSVSVCCQWQEQTCGKGDKLTVLVQDVVDLLEGDALGSLGEVDDEGDGLDGDEAGRRGGGVGVLRDGESAAVGVLEFNFEDTVLLEKMKSACYVSPIV